MKYKLSEEEKERIQSNPWLTIRERKVFELFYRDGKYIEDIAAEFELNRSTINRILREIRDKSKIYK